MCTRPRRERLSAKGSVAISSTRHRIALGCVILNYEEPASRPVASLQLRARLLKCVVQVLFLFQNPFCIRDYVCKFLWGAFNRLV
jgi:hypothetical protein